MFGKSKILALLLGLLVTNLFAQEDKNCYLNIAAQAKETFAGVFQLNDEQMGKLELLSREIADSNAQLEAQIQKLLDSHPQTTEEELIKLSDEYRGLKDQYMAQNRAYDKKFLQLLNPKQYQRYMDLCQEAGRVPIENTEE